MMWVFSLFLAVLQQAPAPAERILVCLTDGQQLVIENPEFSGFIQGHGANAILIYRQQEFHGRIPLNTISRIEFGKYERGKPFAMTLTLTNGQRLDVESEIKDFVTVRGKTVIGTVTINHPDPVSGPLRLSTKKPNRKHDLTIQCLEFPAS